MAENQFATKIQNFIPIKPQVSVHFNGMNFVGRERARNVDFNASSVKFQTHPNIVSELLLIA